jgi:acetate kinase
MKILVLNAGSSSQKCGLYEFDGKAIPATPPEPLWEGLIDWNHQPGTVEIKIKTQQLTRTEAIPMTSKAEIMRHLISTLWNGETQVVNGVEAIDCVGHRVVHGGQDYQQSVLITPTVKGAIEKLSAFAPLHNPANLEGIEIMEQLGDLPQVAVFDTAFHAQMPLTSAVYPLPYAWYEQGIQRYGWYESPICGAAIGTNSRPTDSPSHHLSFR